MRLGFILGFLLGAALASLFSAAEREKQAPEGARGSGPQQILSALKQHVRDAKEAAQEASLEKQAEMQRDYEAAKHRPPGRS
jgi:hypothetical protein